jgi:hypothetical protein
MKKLLMIPLVAMLSFGGKAPETHTFQSDGFETISLEVINVPAPTTLPTSIDIVLSCESQRGAWIENTGANWTQFQFLFTSQVTLGTWEANFQTAPMTSILWTDILLGFDGTIDYAGDSGKGGWFPVEQYPNVMVLTLTDREDIAHFMKRDPAILLDFAHSVSYTTNGSATSVRRWIESYQGSITYNY